MADNTSTFVLRVKTEGMPEAKKDSQIIRDNLEGAQKAASGTATSRKVASSAAAMPTGAAGASAGITGGEVAEYNRASGAAGKAGGTARDFADQARGLGGLVRLYATVAANVFALTAAFGALSRAMDTTNMIKGLDQLGAASGVALGSLSKRLYTATDGAVSLREAMEATVKASSAGLNSTQILQMGDVAKKASQALGVNMTDALSRLSRGISKLEPELLDELGIFVKIDDATTKYALSVGKSTTALTDFEKRQAFANAVLEQGNKKFGEIQIDSNPYAKLAASFQNLVQSGLELVNKVFAPIARILADNSVLLAGAFALIATKVLKMAIPALGQWQKQLLDTANTAKEKAQAINTAFGEAWVDRWETRLKLPELRAGVKTATEELKKIGVPAGVTKNVGEGYSALLKGEEMSKTQVTATKLAITSKRKELEALGEVQDKNSKKQAAALQREIGQLEAIVALNTKRVQLNVAEETIGEKAGKKPGFFTGDAQRDRRAKAASTTAIALGELAALPGQTLEKGFMDSMKNMKANLDKQGVGFIKKWSTMAVGALASATTAIGLFAASIQMWVAAFAIVGIAIYGVIKYFSATKKEAELTSEAMTRLEDASKNAALTLERISMANPLESLSVESIQARANALKELGDSGALAVKRALDEISKMNVGDQFLNWISKLWGGDVQTKLSEGLADSIRNAFKLAEDTKLTAEAKQSIETILGASIQTADLDKIVRKLATSGEDAKLKQIVKIIESMGNAAAISAAKGTELKESFTKVTTGIQEFNKSLIPTDSLSKIASDSAVAAKKLGLALQDPVQALTAMKDVSGNVDMLSIFPADVAKNLMSYNSELTVLAGKIAQAKTATTGYDKEIENLNKDIKTLGTTYQPGSQTEQKVNEIKQQIADIESKKLQLKADIDADTSKVKGVFDQAVRSSLILSAEQMAARLAVEMNKANSVVTSTMAGLLGDTVGGIKLRAELEKDSIKANMEATKQSFALANKMEELKIEMERKRLQDEKFNLETKSKATPEQESRLKAITAREKELDSMETGLKGKGMGQSSVALAKGGASADVVALQQRFEQFRVQLASGGAQLKAVDLKTEYEKAKRLFELEQKALDVRIESANAEKERASILSNIYGIENQSATSAKIIAETSAQNLADEKARNALVFDTDQKAKLYVKVLNDIAQAGSKATKEQKDQAEYFLEALVESGRQVDQFDEALKIRIKTRDINNEILRISSSTAFEQKKLEFDKQRTDLAFELQQIAANGAKQEFDSLASRGRLDEEYAAKRIAQLALEAQQIQYNKQLSDAASQKRIQDLQAEDQFKKAIASGGNELDALLEWAAQTEKNNTLYKDRINTINANNDYTQRGINIEKNKAIEIAKTNKLLEDQKDRADAISSLGDSLAAAFGKAGASLSGFLSALDNLIANQETYNSKIEEQYDILDKSREIMNDPTKTDKERADAANAYTKAQKESGKLTAKNAQDELTNNAKLIGAAKGLFKEKSAGYKILSGIEKAMHIQKMVMWAQEQAADLARTMSSSSNSLVRGLADGAAAVAKTLSSIPFPANIAAAAAVAAIVKSLFGNGPNVQPVGFTAQEQQKVQGTGQVLRDGKLVETGAGVLGDATAKSKSVENALQNMEKYDFKNLEYSNQMLEALKGIRKNTENFAGNLLRSIPGLNIKPETIKSGGWLFGKDTTEVLDQGIKIVGTVGNIIDQTAQIFKYQNTKTTSGGLLNLGLGFLGAGTSYNPTEQKVTNPALQRDLSLIFKDVGKALGGAAEQLGMGTATEILNAFRSVDLSEEFKRISTMDLKPDEMVDALMSVISSGMDMAAMQLMPSLDKFRKAGESFADTVLRVANDTRVVSLSFEELGMALPRLVEEGAKPTAEQLSRVTRAQEAYNLALADTKKITETVQFGYNGDTISQTIGSPEATAALAIAEQELAAARNAVSLATNSLTTRNIELVQSYIDAAGGLDQFVERNRFFAENFLTEAERLAPIQERVRKEIARLSPDLAELGITAVANRDQFKQAVFAAEALGEAGVQLYSDLMKLAPAFAEVNKEIQNASLSVEEFSRKVMGNELDILKTQASLLEANKDYEGAYSKLQETLLLSRKAELVELEKLPKAQSDVLIAQAKYKWSLEDIANATKLAEQINKRLIDSYNQQITVLQGFVNYLDEATGLVNQALRLRGQGTDLGDATYIERTLKLQDIANKYAGAENEQRRKNITGLQKFIWALEDEKAAKDSYVKALEAQKAAIQAEITDLQKLLSGYDKLIDQQATIKELTGAGTAAGKLIAREKELANLRTEYAGQLLNSIVRNQEYIWALEDEQAIKDKLIEQRDKEKSALESTITTIKDSIKAIKDYKKSLMFSSELSVLTPEQQYKEAKTIFEQTLTAARTTGIDEAGVQAQQKALSDLPEASNKLLELSRTLFASSGNYMTDYKVVQDALTATESALGEQLTDAERQLDELTKSTKFLDSINQNTQTTADLLVQYTAAQSRTSAAAALADTRTIEDLQSLKNNVQNQIDTRLKSIESIDKDLKSLGEKQLTTQEATEAASKASAAYNLAVSNTSKALADISADVNGGTIAQAIVARQAALDAINNARQQIDLLNAVKNNTYAVYASQVAHFQNLISTPQQVNVGEPIAQALATIARNTAATANRVDQVQATIVAGTKATVSNNTAVSENTAEVIVAAVQSQAAAWRGKTVPVILSGSGVLMTPS